MKYEELPSSRLIRLIRQFADNIPPGDNTQRYLSLTTEDFIKVLSTLSTKQIEDIKEETDKIFGIFAKDGDNDDNYCINIDNILKDLLSPYGEVVKIVNKKGFFTEIINSVGVYRADDIIRCSNYVDYGNEIVFICIYPDKNKFRFYGWWAPIETALAIIGIAMSDKELLPKRLSKLLVDGTRIEEEILPPDWYGEEFAKRDYLKHDDR